MPPVPRFLRLDPRLSWAIPICRFFVLVVRHWDSLVYPQFIYEDAGAFWAATFVDSGPTLVLRPWAGFLRVSQRLIFLGLRLSPAQIAPALAELILFGAVALLAAFVVSSRLRDAIPSQASRNVLAAFLFVIPATTEMLGSVLNIEWFLWVFLVCLSLASVPGRRVSVIEGLVALVAGVTGPIVVALLPVLVWRLGRRRPWLILILALCALCQVATFALIGQRAPVASDFAGSISAFLRQTASAVLGARFGDVLDMVAFPWLLTLAGLLILAAILISARSLPRPTAVILIWSAAAAALAGLMSVGAPNLQIPGQNSRYFVMVSIGAAAAAAVAADRQRLVGLALLGALIFGCVGDFRVDAFPRGEWATKSACIGGAEACVLGVYPDLWSVSWPGPNEPYVMPVGFTPDGLPRY
jgi:hypothetical protein